MAPPDQFEIGRQTFFDFGPPFDYYELFVVRPTANGTSIERVILTPPGDECCVPAKLEAASALVNESVDALLGSRNPCLIPENELRRELKRRRKGLVFSGAKVVIQVQCGAQTRLVRSEILDRDMFDTAPSTPKNTSWTMQLLERLDKAVGPGVMDKPIFPILEKEEPTGNTPSPIVLRDLSAGKYDALFPDSPDKPSALYRAAQNHPAPPTVRLVSSVPQPPEVYPLPEYPPLAKLARVEGAVTFEVEVDANGSTVNVSIESGHPLLQAAVKKAVEGWKFPEGTFDHRIHATIEFALNCPKRAEEH